MDSLTKKDLVGLLDQLYDRFSLRVDDLEKRVDTRIDYVFQKLDAVYGEVVTTRQEREAHHQVHTDLRDEIDTIKSLPTITHELKHHQNSSD